MVLLDGGLTLNCAFYKVVEEFADENQDVVFGIDLNFAERTSSVTAESESLVDYVSLLAEMFIGMQNEIRPASDRALDDSTDSPHKIHYITLSKHYPLLVVTDEDKQNLFAEGFKSIE
ncbi:MAG: hypothetical protein EOO77_43465 [Oxalobacteraceae bacterium]|nr:MAG: hypothetical protein EOO77_43465 [Oxalobacteraceae bacterium]